MAELLAKLRDQFLDAAIAHPDAEIVLCVGPDEAFPLELFCGQLAGISWGFKTLSGQRPADAVVPRPTESGLREVMLFFGTVEAMEAARLLCRTATNSVGGYRRPGWNDERIEGEHVHLAWGRWLIDTCPTHTERCILTWGTTLAGVVTVQHLPPNRPLRSDDFQTPANVVQMGKAGFRTRSCVATRLKAFFAVSSDILAISDDSTTPAIRPVASLGEGAQSIDSQALLSPRRLAELFDVPYEALRNRLRRWQEANKAGGWTETTGRKPKEPKYLYQLAAVRHIIDELKRATSETTSERPAKKS